MHERYIHHDKQEKEEKARLEKEVHDLKNSNLFLEEKIAEMSLEIDSLRDRVTESDSQGVRMKNAGEECTRSGRTKDQQEKDEEERPEGSNLRQGLEAAIRVLRDQVQDLVNERQTSEKLISRLQQQNQDLTYELGNVKEELNTSREAFAEEKDQWQEEKQKVLRYQKQLNHNLVLVLKRNKEIESELKALKDKTSYKIITDETKC